MTFGYVADLDPPGDPVPIDLETAIRVRACDDGGRGPVTATIASDDAQRDSAPVLDDCLLTQG